ncbi:Fungal specific transcription factor domain containing protein [Ceratobasidium theobromae]|uniref:Fungal specific transcription factor domain containing protein n=1 Tax=Ceratobasidium theobromae TaxID=1582974 RepID=A0A5N5QHU2_9AGAM|nr:Fungal specific transcription factor domain containing protein [Ceratobasidium theobromae]
MDDKQQIIDGLLRIISRPHTEPGEVWKWIERAARTLAAPSEEPEEHLPEDSAPLGLLAELSLDAKGCTDDVGVANGEYFRPGPMAHPDLRRIIVERQMVPEILTLGVVSDAEAEHLFRIFHERIDVSLWRAPSRLTLQAVIAIIDPTIHTVAGVKARCPFLFTVVCAIASRYWVERPELYTVLMHHAKAAAATAITDGWKSLEVCQAYLLLSVYPQPARSWAEDRAWLYLGCAIRLAMDLNLYKLPTRSFVNEAHEREVLNRTRTWLICFNMYVHTLPFVAHLAGTAHWPPSSAVPPPSPRTISSATRANGGAAPSSTADSTSISATTHSSSAPSPATLASYTRTQRAAAASTSTEFGPITRAFDDEMDQFRQDAEHAYSTAPDPRHPTCMYRLALMPLAVAYYRLVMYSFGLEHAHRSASEPGNMFLLRSIDTASEVLRITNEELPMHEYHRYSPDGHWMWSVFAAAFLIKLAKPRTVQPPHLTMTESQREAALGIVWTFVATLECSAVDERHSPALYARFLRRVLGERAAGASATGSSVTGSSVTGSASASVTGYAPGPAPLHAHLQPNHHNQPQSNQDLLAAMYALQGDFWDNALLPGTWGMSAA